ncbi:MAG TPA: LPS export ABC transporter periplasmic protein LptC [Deltaproteobacteria bacterium]|nr:LPS export ABC transporter periplasmic protein LptC [Deltaproteobacteria bacterium]
MNRRLKGFLVTFIVLSVAALAALSLVNGRIKREVNAIRMTVDREAGMGVKIDNVRYSGMKEGRREWELEAETATYYKGEDLAVLDDVKAVLYSEAGTYTLRGREGRYFGSAGRIDVSGGVTVVSVEAGGGGYRLETERISYFTDEKRISTDDEVRLFSAAFDVDGVGLRIDIDEGRLTVLDDVKTVLKDASLLSAI